MARINHHGNMTDITPAIKERNNNMAIKMAPFGFVMNFLFDGIDVIVFPGLI
jgi:hypothetical protein